MIHAILGVVLLGAAGLSPAAGVQEPQLEGVWRGTSECVVKNGPCHDETNVYRITPVARIRYRFIVKGSKIVDGQEILMGQSKWDYDAATRTLTTSIGNGHFQLKIDGDKMDGDLTLADGSVYRKIHLARSSE